MKVSKKHSISLFLLLSLTLIWGSSDLHALGNKQHDAEHCPLCVIADQGMESSEEFSIHQSHHWFAYLSLPSIKICYDSRKTTLSPRAPPPFFLS